MYTSHSVKYYFFSTYSSRPLTHLPHPGKSSNIPLQSSSFSLSSSWTLLCTVPMNKPVQRINLEVWPTILTKSVLPFALRWNPSLMWLVGQSDHRHWYPIIFETAAPFLTWNAVITPISHTSINWGVNVNWGWYMFRPHKSNHSTNFFAEPGF